jgi:glutamate synthase domain-containing protein 2
MPLREGLMLTHNSLVGVGLRDQISIAASGKRAASYEIASAMALGANWCNIARGFMFSIGCIQSQSCHSNKCPVGVASQDPRLMRGLVVEDKAQRAFNFHTNTVQGLADITAACGLDHPNEFTPRHLYERISPHEVRRYDQLYDFFEPGQLLDGRAGRTLQADWDDSSPKTFSLA